MTTPREDNSDRDKTTQQTPSELTPSMVPTSAASAPTSLTQWLRTRTNGQLAELLRRRPDLALPTPADLAALASRISIRTSAQRIVDSLAAFPLAVLQALVLVSEADGSATLDDAAALLGPINPDHLDEALTELFDVALVWSSGPTLHLVSAVKDAIGLYPAQLGRPAAVLLRHLTDQQLAPILHAHGLRSASQPRAGAMLAALFADAEKITEFIAKCDESEREILDRLAAGPPVGNVRNAQAIRTGDDATAAQRLIRRGMLVPIDAQRVELPRELAVALRGEVLITVCPTPPEIPVVDRDPAELDRIGGTSVLEAVRLVQALGQAWARHAPPQLRAGGLGVRELRRTAATLGVDEPMTALILETAMAASLINSTTGIDPVYLPTAEFDQWCALSIAERWTHLANAWTTMTRQPSLVSQRGDRDRVISALSPDAERAMIPLLRGHIMDLLAELPPGDAPAERAAVLARLAWLSPRRAGTQHQLAEAILDEADLLGITAAGGLTGYSRTLRAGAKVVAEQVLTDALPAPVDSFLVQPDLTIVVPGPPTPDLSHELDLVADLESSGGASVYRITDSSIRRALDTGQSSSTLIKFVADHSRTEVPQALTYVIEDAARRHGNLRAGVASAYLRCDDEALLARVLADRETAGLHLQQLAPTVAISAVPVTRLLETLRSAGYAPAAESPQGEVISLNIEAVRAPARTPNRSFRERATPDTAARRLELVRRIRSGDALTALTRTVPEIAQTVPGVTSAATMGLLRTAIKDSRRVLIGCAEADGTSTRHTILPISMAGGFVRGHEAETQHLQAFPLHRVTGVRLLDDDQSEPNDNLA